MSRLLLVTGARALSETRMAKIWASDLISAAMGWWRPDVLVHGGCAGSPDEWAGDYVRDDWRYQHIATRVFLLDGQIVAQGALPPEVTTFLDRWDECEPLATRDRFRIPLRRNRAMVNAVTCCGADVLVLALRAPWAKTNGTAHTARLAREAGLLVAERMCPAEHAPMREQP